MEAPEKIYLNFGEITKEEFEKSNFDEFADVTWCQDKVFENDVEYIRKDIVDNMLKTAEDHAYFAGSEAMMENAVEWLNNNVASYFGFPTNGNLLGDLRKALIKN